MQSLRTPLVATARQATRRIPSVPAVTQTSGVIRQHAQRAAFSTSPERRDANTTASVLTSPLNLPKWLEQNSHLLKPPINNHLIYNDPLTVQIVGGPNARTDYHINETPEFFYQYKGRMLLKTVEPKSNQFKDIYIDEGELFLLPANTPHNPVRFENTVGVVLELPRPETSLDRLRWYCRNCGSVVHEASFYCTDLGTQIKSAVEEFKGDKEARTCKQCGEVNDSAPTAEAMEQMRNGPS